MIRVLNMLYSVQDFRNNFYLVRLGFKSPLQAAFETYIKEKNKSLSLDANNNWERCKMLVIGN